VQQSTSKCTHKKLRYNGKIVIIFHCYVICLTSDQFYTISHFLHQLKHGIKKETCLLISKLLLARSNRSASTMGNLHQ